ncbi:MAG: hypothetical protein JF623_06765, partial [Acidobacteria bacterium]|nr:hypothetical protein [Acidobacteriota bacterium]
MTLHSTPPSGRNVGRGEAAAYVGFALIALHVLDDNFFEPQPGTSAGQHLVSGLVPVAVLALIVAAYRRVSAGARASLAIVTGAFGIVMGAGEAVYYSLKLGPSDDDYTGLLAFAAGWLLVGIGVVILWQTRRRGPTLARRLARRSLLAIAAVAGAYFIFLPFGLSYIFTHSARAVVPKAKLGAAYENVAFSTADGLTLRGWYVPSRNGAAVIAAPGRAGAQRPARMLAR